jgi:hypothetical protein
MAIPASETALSPIPPNVDRSAQRNRLQARDAYLGSDNLVPAGQNRSQEDGHAFSAMTAIASTSIRWPGWASACTPAPRGIDAFVRHLPVPSGPGARLPPLFPV